MSQYWQKKPLLIRQAAPEFAGRFLVDDLFELAESHDVESRLVSEKRGRWSLERGPLDPERRSSLSKRQWSLLVQGVNLFDDDADALLAQFRFIPDARLDDLMISYAVDGGGVGPHFDSYDVFLLQTEGRRRWRISEQKDLSLDPRQPMRILDNFRAEQEWILEPGDMLYLPPHVAHEGVAIGECITCSIGFRAPGENELTAQFLHTLAERVETRMHEEGFSDPRYQDPQQGPVTQPAALPSEMVSATLKVLQAVRWDEEHVSAFLGEYLSEPKQNVYFDAPSRPVKRDVFVKRALARGLRLDNGTRMLYDGKQLYINGETVPRTDRDSRRRLCELADKRVLDAHDVVTLSNDSPIVPTLYEWYRAGWIHLV